MAPSNPNSIPEEELGELWFAFNHSILEQLQCRAREMGAAGETQKLIAERLGRDPASINRWLRGRSNMTMRTMHDLARAMSCRLKVELQRLDLVKPSNTNANPWTVPAPADVPILASMAKASLSPDETNSFRASLRSFGDQGQMHSPLPVLGSSPFRATTRQNLGPLEQQIPEAASQ
jgi:transcriptional regulator with XRE-family HTH domain